MIAMTVIREYKLSELSLKDQFATSQETVVASSSLSTNSLLQGATSRTSTTIGRSATVKAGEDIRPALESLRSAGGGVLVLLAGVHRPTYDIIGGAKINIIGEGIDQTIIDFGNGPYSIKYTTSGTKWALSDMTVRNSSTIGVNVVTGADDYTIDRVRATACSIGFSLSSANSFTISMCTADANVNEGFSFAGGTGQYTVSNCLSKDNGGRGFNDNLGGGIYLACRATNNGSNGFDLDNGGGVCVGCTAKLNTGSGFYLATQATILVGCVSTDNQIGNNITEGAANNGLIIGCVLDSNSIDTIGPGFKSVGNSLSFGNMEGSFVSEKMIYGAINRSGVARVDGEVVVYATGAGGNEITSTTTVGDNRVVGVVISVNNSNNFYGTVQTLGFIDSLKVNGTTDIAVGDFLCTYSVAGISAKAAAGNMAFAIALEAYTANDSLGVIDALLITPRKL